MKMTKKQIQAFSNSDVSRYLDCYADDNNCEYSEIPLEFMVECCEVFIDNRGGCLYDLSDEYDRREYESLKRVKALYKKYLPKCDMESYKARNEI